MNFLQLLTGEDNVTDNATIAGSLLIALLLTIDPTYLNEWEKLALTTLALIWLGMRFWVWIIRVWRRRHDVSSKPPTQ